MKTFITPLRVILQGYVIVRADDEESAIEDGLLLDAIDDEFYANASLHDWGRLGAPEEIE